MSWADIKLREPDHGENLRFLLQSKEQFQKLPGAIESLQNTTFVQSGSSTESEETDTEAEE